VASALGGRVVSPRLSAGAGAIAPGVIVALGTSAGGARTRAQQARQWDRITTGGVHAVAGLWGPPCRRDDPAALAVCRQLACAPRPTRSRGIDEDQGCGVGWQRAPAWSHVAWPRPHGATGEDRSVVLVGAISHRDGVRVDLQTAIECASLGHG
jgi:hypothetical protein